MKNNILFYITLIILIIILFYLFNNYLKIEKFTDKKSKENNKICCFYAYYEKNELYKNNLKYFLDNGILDNVDYYIIINGKCSIDIPNKSNIIIYKKENQGYDFGAYSYAIKILENKKLENYDYYFFINSSVRGPYLKNKNMIWTDEFIKLFKNNVKIVGTTINIYPLNKFPLHKSKRYNLNEIYSKEIPFTHIQSMFFCIDKEYYHYLKKIDFFNEEEMNNAPDIYYIIANKEIGLSQIALKNGWNINSILSKFKDINYLNIKSDFNTSSKNGDPYYPKAYFGKNIDKNEVIFYKINRNIEN